MSHQDVSASVVAVSRWEPHAKQRLEQAALALYTERGYAETTVGDIAEHAGVTPRTFFRYFPDKREVLFEGADELRDRVAAAVRDAPASLTGLDAILHGLPVAEQLFHHRDHLRRRAAVVATAPELREREAMKLATIATALEDALIERGDDPAGAQLAADAGVAVFKLAGRLWVDDDMTPYPQLLASAVTRLYAIVHDAPQNRHRMCDSQHSERLSR